MESLTPHIPVLTPVAFFVFNRLATTRTVFDAIALARPATLLLIADGPRPDRPGEAELCAEVRALVSHVTWPCTVHTCFADHNLGCQERLISGLDWVFSLVEEAIILEDDCLPDPTFFPFCQQLLERYRGDSRVAAICGTNLVQQHLKTDASYFFSQLGGIWGWATWRSEWKRYDRYMTAWPAMKQDGILSELFDRPATAAYWTRMFDDMYQNKGRSTWDYQWVCTRLRNHGLTIVPRVNLVANLGFGQGATHTAEVDSRLTPPVGAVRFPLTHPLTLIPLRSMDQRYQDLLTRTLAQRLAGRLKRMLRSAATRRKAGRQQADRRFTDGGGSPA